MRLCLPNLSQNHTRTTKKCSKATRYLQIVAHFSTMNFWEFEYPFFLHNILIIRSSNCVKSVDKSMFCSVWKGIFRYIVNRWSTWFLVFGFLTLLQGISNRKCCQDRGSFTSQLRYIWHKTRQYLHILP